MVNKKHNNSKSVDKQLDWVSPGGFIRVNPDRRNRLAGLFNKIIATKTDLPVEVKAETLQSPDPIDWEQYREAMKTTPDKTLADQLGVTQDEVHSIRLSMGIKHPRGNMVQRPDIDWEQYRETMKTTSDEILAEQLGVTKSKVFTMRLSMGILRPRGFAVQRPDIDWEMQRENMRTMSDIQLGELLGVDRYMVRRHRLDLGIKHHGYSNPAKSNAIDWEQYRETMKTTTDKLLAEQLGVDPNTVRRWRVKLGISRRQYKIRVKRTSIDWEQYRTAMKTVSDVDLAKQLGVTPSAVRKHRKNFGIKLRPHGNGAIDWQTQRENMRTMSDSALAEKLGVNVYTVIRRRLNFGIYHDRSNTSRPDINWSDYVHEMKTQSDLTLGQKLGVSRFTVRINRLKLGIQKTGDSKSTGQRGFDWSNYTHLLGTMDDQMLADQIGMSLSSVQKKRLSLGIKLKRRSQSLPERDQLVWFVDKPAVNQAMEDSLSQYCNVAYAFHSYTDLSILATYVAWFIETFNPQYVLLHHSLRTNDQAMKVILDVADTRETVILVPQMYWQSNDQYIWGSAWERAWSTIIQYGTVIIPSVSYSLYEFESSHSHNDQQVSA